MESNKGLNSRNPRRNKESKIIKSKTDNNKRERENTRFDHQSLAELLSKIDISNHESFRNSVKSTHQNELQSQCSSIRSSLSSLRSVSTNEPENSRSYNPNRRDNTKNRKDSNKNRRDITKNKRDNTQNRRDNVQNQRDRNFNSHQYSLLKSSLQNKSLGSSLSSLLSHEDFNELGNHENAQSFVQNRRDRNVKGHAHNFSSGRFEPSQLQRGSSENRGRFSSLRSSVTSLFDDDEINEPKGFGNTRNFQVERRFRVTSLFDDDNISEPKGFGNSRNFQEDLEERRGFRASGNEGYSNQFMYSLIKKNDDGLTRTIFKNKYGFKYLFTSFNNANTMTVIYKLLKRLTAVSDLKTKEYLFSFVMNQQFIENTNDFISCILSGSSNAVVVDILQNLIKFHNDILKIISSEVSNDYCELFKNILSKVEKYEGIPDSILSDIKGLLLTFSKSVVILQSNIDTSNLSVFPTHQDLIEHNECQPNIIKGSYESPELYLNIHFKLLKNDFVLGLRSGLQEYKVNLKQNKTNRLKEIFLYDATYCGFSMDKKKNNLTVSFEIDNLKLKKVDWETSKRLIHGCLLLVSNDNFQTFYLTVLDNRTLPKFESKTFTISVTLVEKLIDWKEYTRCSIIEPKVFFPPYFQVLKTLKSFHSTVFPMERYIIDVNSDINPPIYLNNDTKFNINENEINFHDIKSWENHDSLGLNYSQVSALQAALTNELVIIQGPPGTGKSYLGLKIINILLNNKFKWNGGESPILVICFRNNAVDQILESLVKDNRKVVRLGNQSTNDLIKDKCLRNAVKDVPTNPAIRDQIKSIKTEIDNLKSKIFQLKYLVICVNDKKVVLSIEIIKKVMTPKQNDYFIASSNMYEEWLFGDKDTNDDLHVYNEESFENIMCNELQINHGILKELKANGSLLLTVYDLKNDIFCIESTIDSMYEELYRAKEGAYRFYDEEDEKLFSNEMLSSIVQLLQKHEKKELLLRKFINRINLTKGNLANNNCFDIANLSEMSISDRWELYDFWTAEFVKLCEEKISEIFTQLNEKKSTLDELFDVSDGYKLQHLKPEVVGGTTTGAARLHSLLNVLKPKIVVFEEAAEVLEAHTIASITQFCEHIILIGDHQQLRPNPASHESVAKYKLDVSLFERMITNDIQFYPLNEQHRMRPLISSLVIPQFYPKLKNHESVEKYPNVRGLKDNMFFLEHIIPEDEINDSDSHRNKYEASFALGFAVHLLKNGYEKKDITILTFYGAQFFYLKSLRANEPSLKGLSIEIVDNFQGEENKIIILSLVRSNPFSIGFLSKMNRICVALTRAREGFYLVGNMTTLKGNSSVWKGIFETLSKNKVIGNELPLKCNTHGTITMVKSSKDFIPLCNGGCTLRCGTDLGCGHTCDLICHGSDELHSSEYCCKKPCERKRGCGIHDCNYICGKECPQCKVIIEAVLPCGHPGSKVCQGEFLPCSSKCRLLLPCGHPCLYDCHYPAPHLEGDESDKFSYVCKHSCDKVNANCQFLHNCIKACGVECGECIVDTMEKLPCGHMAAGKCYTFKNKICQVLIEKDLECGHTCEVKCFQIISEVTCTKTKNITLQCGHENEVPCPYDGSEKIDCTKEVEKQLKCGHLQKVPCCLFDSNKFTCNELVMKELQCDHGFKLDKCSIHPDDVKCTQKVKKRADCGHNINILCHLSNEPVLCDRPCNLIKSCGHKCSGLCGNPCPDCPEVFETKIDCGHLGYTPCHIKEEDQVDSDDFKSINFGLFDCKVLCKSKLNCSHNCEGTCGKCMQGRVHEICSLTCDEKLLCGHKCSAVCEASLHLCNQNCLNSCVHQVCKNKCGDFCQKCKKKCVWKCAHYECSKLCFEACDRPPCESSCKILLECGHPCMGFCGEPCPPICLICSYDNIKDTKYLLLEDCGHIISLEEISLLISSNLGLLLCPSCQKPLVKTRYLRDYSKSWFSMYPRIKNILLKRYDNSNSLKNDLKPALNKFFNLLQNKTEDLKELKSFLNYLVKTTKDVKLNRKKDITIESLRSLLFVSYFILEAFRLLEVGNKTYDPMLLSRINHLAFYLKHQNLNISRHQMFQYNNELLRLSMLCDLIKIKEKGDFDILKQDYFDKAWNFACGMNSFDEETRKNIVYWGNQISERNKINEMPFDSRFLSKFEKYYSLTTHRTNWGKCYKNHLFYCIDSSMPHSDLDCPSCKNKKEWFLP